MLLTAFFWRYQGSAIQLGWPLALVVRVSGKLQVECMTSRCCVPLQYFLGDETGHLNGC